MVTRRAPNLLLKRGAWKEPDHIPHLLGWHWLAEIHPGLRLSRRAVIRRHMERFKLGSSGTDHPSLRPGCPIRLIDLIARSAKCPLPLYFGLWVLVPRPLPVRWVFLSSTTTLTPAPRSSRCSTPKAGVFGSFQTLRCF